MAGNRPQSSSECLALQPTSESPLIYDRSQDSHAAAGQPASEQAFFRHCFALDTVADPDPWVVHVPLRSFGSGPAWETWHGPQPTYRALNDGIAIIASADHAVVHTRAAVSGDIGEMTHRLYAKLLSRIRKLDCPHLVRIWNFVPEINTGTGDAETYVRFNAGRAAAFDDLGLRSSDSPAGTAVGSPAGSPLVVIALVSRSAPTAIENPRQTSAYHYPRQYGPRTPAFARATFLPEPGGGRLFISGTASIIGHESQHAAVGAQLDETLTNLECLRNAALKRFPGLHTAPESSFRVYVRNNTDFPHVVKTVRQRLGDSMTALLLQADICRRELLVEIEGICRLTTAA